MREFWGFRSFKAIRQIQHEIMVYWVVELVYSTKGISADLRLYHEKITHPNALVLLIMSRLISFPKCSSDLCEPNEPLSTETMLLLVNIKSWIYIALQ